MPPLKSALILVGVVGGVIFLAWLYLGYFAPDIGDASMSGQGTFAMVLGIVFSLVVGIGLMGLLFFSHNRGYDDRLARREDPSPPVEQPGREPSPR